jgi:predicted DCC family thiol-disulfide oxidoreductase YuxK
VPDPLTDPRWTLVYDADCGFCKWTVSVLIAWDRRGLLEPRGEHGIDAVGLIAPDGERYSAGAALAPLLRLLPGGAVPARLLERFPGATNRAYDWVAGNRSKLSKVVRSDEIRLPDAAHATRPWRIHEVVPDFRLEDVWALPTPGGEDEFPALVRLAASLDPSRSSSRAVRTLFAIRWKIGGLLGWDTQDSGLGARVTTLRDRLPADLREGPGPAFAALPFTSLYETGDEFAAEIANRTMHGVLHLGWVPDEAGGYRGQMAVYVKPNGLLGRAYMAAIAPFRHLLVYPPVIGEIGRAWARR